MTANQLSSPRALLLSPLCCVFGLLVVLAPEAGAQNVGDWETVPSLANGIWDNTSLNALGNDSTWQMWDGSEWVVETGKTDGVDYPDNNTGAITILAGTTITNNTGGTGITADGITVASGGCLQFYKAAFTLQHNGNTTYDIDVFGSIGLSNSTANNFLLNPGAIISIENGGVMTNYGATSGDVFGGGYTSNSVVFQAGSLFVLTGTKATSVPLATWSPSSTFLFAPTPAATTGFTFSQFTGQTYGNFIWNWPTQPAKVGTSVGNQGNVAMAGNFYIANANGQTNEDMPFSGFTMTVGGNIGLTNVAYFPTASPGTATIMVGGNFIVDTSASIKINSGTGIGAVIFDGTSPQTLGIYGTNGSPGSWNWTVNSGSTVNLDSPLTNNSGVSGTAGFLTDNGTLNLTSHGLLTGSGVISLGTGAILNVSATGGITLAGNETLTGSGKVIGATTAGSTSVIHPGLGLPLTFNGNLTYGSVTSTNVFDLTSSPSGANDQIVVSGGVLTGNSAQIVINATSGILSTTSDYVLFNVTGGGSISHTFTGPAWTNTPPANSNNYNIVISGNQVLLHYGTVAVPQPGITNVSLSGASNLHLSGTNAVAGNYIVLTTTNLGSTNWTPVATNTLTSGNFSFIATNAVKAGDSQQFYKLQAP